MVKLNYIKLYFYSAFKPIDIYESAEDYLFDLITLYVNYDIKVEELCSRENIVGHSAIIYGGTECYRDLFSSDDNDSFDSGNKLIVKINLILD
jgi:hypothetical protein